MKELWDIIKKYLGDAWTVILSSWYLLKVDNLSKINQLIITVYLLFLFYHAYRKRYPKKSKVITLTEKIIKKGDKAVKFLVTDESLEETAESGLNLMEKIRKDGKGDFMKIINLIAKLLTFIFKTNIVTMSNNALASYIYYIFIEDIIQANTWNQHNIIWFSIYTALFVIALLGINGPGLETFKKWAIRVNNGKLTKYIDKLQKFELNDETKETIKKYIARVKTVLNVLKESMKEETYKKWTMFLTDIENKIIRFDAEKILAEEEARQKALLLAKAMKGENISENKVVIK